MAPIAVVPIAVVATAQFLLRLPKPALGARLLLLGVIAFHVFYDSRESDSVAAAVAANRSYPMIDKAMHHFS
jgi:hypothetical protein